MFRHIEVSGILRARSVPRPQPAVSAPSSIIPLGFSVHSEPHPGRSAGCSPSVACESQLFDSHRLPPRPLVSHSARVWIPPQRCTCQLGQCLWSQSQMLEGHICKLRVGTWNGDEPAPSAISVLGGAFSGLALHGTQGLEDASVSMPHSVPNLHHEAYQLMHDAHLRCRSLG